MDSIRILSSGPRRARLSTKSTDPFIDAETVRAVYGHANGLTGLKEWRAFGPGSDDFTTVAPFLSGSLQRVRLFVGCPIVDRRGFPVAEVSASDLASATDLLHRVQAHPSIRLSRLDFVLKGVDYKEAEAAILDQIVALVAALRPLGQEVTVRANLGGNNDNINSRVLAGMSAVPNVVWMEIPRDWKDVSSLVLQDNAFPALETLQSDGPQAILSKLVWAISGPLYTIDATVPSILVQGSMTNLDSLFTSMGSHTKLTNLSLLLRHKRTNPPTVLPSIQLMGLAQCADLRSLSLFAPGCVFDGYDGLLNLVQQWRELRQLHIKGSSAEGAGVPIATLPLLLQATPQLRTLGMTFQINNVGRISQNYAKHQFLTTLHVHDSRIASEDLLDGLVYLIRGIAVSIPLVRHSWTGLEQMEEQKRWWATVCKSVSSTVREVA